MVSKKIKVLDKKGLHMRPAKDLSQIAVSSSARVKVRYNGCDYNAKSLIGMLGAGIKYGSEIEIICDGEEEELTLQMMIDYLEGINVEQ